MAEHIKKNASFSLLLLLLLSSPFSEAFRFEDSEGGGRGGDFLDESGLNAVPRIGRRSSLVGGGNAGTSLANRFRFRFNNWRDAGKLGSVGFRFQDSEPSDNNLMVRKRPNGAGGAGLPMEEGGGGGGNVGEDQQQVGLSGVKEVVGEHSGDEEYNLSDDFKRYVLADSYWRDYLATRNKVAEKDRPIISPPALSDEEELLLSQSLQPPGYSNPLPKFLDSRYRELTSDESDRLAAAKLLRLKLLGPARRIYRSNYR